MKKAFLILLVVFLVLYGRIGVELFSVRPMMESAASGVLSDIAERVEAVPLKLDGSREIDGVRNVQQCGDDLFLISGDCLYRFGRSGKLICRITDPSVITVAGYLVDPVKGRLVVMGNENDVCFYSFSGELLSTKKLEGDAGNRHIHCAAICGNRILTAEENPRFDAGTQTGYKEKQIVEYDTSFNKLTTHKLVSAGLNNCRDFEWASSFALGISEETGKLYAYMPPANPEKLLIDTLSIQRRKEALDDNGRDFTVYPLRLGKRFWLSSYRDPIDPEANCTFCYDSGTGRSWQIKGGFRDNICHTGYIPQLKPMDIHSNSYYYCKKDKSERTVIYLVTLKA